MRTYIKKLQSKREVVRKQILVASLVVSMAVVGSVWVYSLNDRFGQKQLAEVDTSVKPFTLFSDSITDAYQNITASVGNFSFSSKKNEKPAPKQIDLIPVEPSTVK